jgi:hypothetical protein
VAVLVAVLVAVGFLSWLIASVEIETVSKRNCFLSKFRRVSSLMMSAATTVGVM